MLQRGFHGSGRREGGHPRSGGHGGDLIGEILQKQPETQILFVGSVNCLRHKPFFSIANYMREGKAPLLCPTMTDFASGRYLRQIRDAVKELSEECGAKQFGLIYGCQWAILSSDGELLKQELKDGMLGTQLPYFIPRDNIVQHAELQRRTVIENAPESAQAAEYRALARAIDGDSFFTVPTPISNEALEALLIKHLPVEG